MAEEGWVRLHRKIKKSTIWGNPSLVYFWVWCLVSADYEEHTTMINGKRKTIHPGQFITGRKIASQETGIPETSVQRYFKTLEKMKMIKRQTTNRYSLITIVNWDKYQGFVFQKNDYEGGTAECNKGDTTDGTAETRKNTNKTCNSNHEGGTASGTASDTTVGSATGTHIKNIYKGDKTSPLNGESFSPEENFDEDDEWDWDWDKVPAPWEDKEDE